MKLGKQWTNSYIVLLSLIRFLFYGRANTRPQNVTSVLVMQATPNLGDMVCITPVFRAIKQKYPKCTLYLMGGGTGIEILKGNPFIDEYISNNASPLELVKKLKGKKIDFAMATNPSTSGLGILYLSGIPLISTFTISGPQTIYSRLYAILKKLVIQVPLTIGSYVPVQYLKLLKPIDIHADDVQLELFYTVQADERVGNLLVNYHVRPGSDFIVAIAPGGSTDIRWWASDKYAKLADYLFKTYHAKIFLIGAGADRKPIEEMIARMHTETEYINLLNQPLEEFKAFLSKTNLIIGNDSGPMTIAKAFRVPHMVFIGPTDEHAYQLPSGLSNRIVKSKTRGTPVTNSANWTSYDEKEARRQIEEITLEDAIRELDILMKNLV